MADYFGKGQFGGHYFKSPEQGQASPAYNPGFETLVPGQVVFSMGRGPKKGYTTEMMFPGGAVLYHHGLRRKRY